MQFTGYMLFKLKDFFYRRKNEWSKSEWESYKREWEIERVISFNKLRYFLFIIILSWLCKEKKQTLREIDGLLFIVYFLPPKLCLRT